MNELTISRSKLCGEIKLSGAKNSVLVLLAASLLTSDKITLNNYPSTLADSIVCTRMLEKLGKTCLSTSESVMEILELNPIHSNLDWTNRSIRTSLLLLGALTTRFGNASVPLPGGCNLGDRAIDIHEHVLKELGADIWQENNTLKTHVPNGILKGKDIHLRLRSTGATENAIICATLAEGTTRIWNPHIRPEIMDLVAMLKSMGAIIEVRGQESIIVEGVNSLSGAVHEVIPDNMEAITWLVASVMTKGDIEIHNFPYRELETPIINLRESGARFYFGDNSLIVRGGSCYPLEISTGPYPGINSDVQPILAAYAACAIGNSTIIDLRFPGRYGYAEEMEKMGISFKRENNILRVIGNGGNFHGERVKALDLRCGIALVLCGLVADGQTIVEDAWQIQRGYDRFTDKLRTLGGNIEFA